MTYFDSLVDWNKKDFGYAAARAGMYSDLYITSSWNRKGYHLSRRTYGCCGDKAEWDKIRGPLSSDEIKAAFEAGIDYWGPNEQKPRVRVKAGRS